MTPRENPFAAARFAPGNLPWIGELDSLVGRVCVPNARLQVIGPHGSGKSTLLVHLARLVERRGWSTCSFRGSRGLDARVLSLRGPLVVFADEAEELGAIRLRSLRALCAMRRAALVITAHRDLGFETLCERAVDTATMEQLVRELLDGADGPCRLDELLARHRGNVREAFFELYDTVST